MKIETITSQGVQIAVVQADELVIISPETALDFVMSVRYESGADYIAINKSAVDERFFILSSGLAGEILQKFINYHVKLAVYGDFSHYTSKPLHDFIYEANQGHDVFFTDTKDTAVEMLVRSSGGI